MRRIVVLMFLLAACGHGDPGAVKVVDCGGDQNPTSINVGDAGFTRNAVVVHKGELLRIATGDTPVLAGHFEADKTTIAPALALQSGVKCFTFDEPGEYGLHTKTFEATVYVRSSISERIFGILDFAAIKWVFLILVLVMPLASLLTWAERRQSAMMQDRLGPNRANIGPIKLKGILHFVADAVKMIFKEDFIPANVHKGLFALAPLIAIAPVLIAFCIIPFGPTVYPHMVTQVMPTAPNAAELADSIRMQIFSSDFGLIFYFAVLTLANYGGTIAGWASYNKWALLGGLRSSSQMMSYEVAMGLSLMGAFLVVGTLEPGAIAAFGATESMSGSNPLNWLWLWQPVGLVLFFTAAIAETKRAPFDIPEGEPEIIGYFVEY
ncbi:MAG: NADH-quinone oxidoreductase subunit H, partial [Kofleriaceae bacterium]